VGLPDLRFHGSEVRIRFFFSSDVSEWGRSEDGKLRDAEGCWRQARGEDPRRSDSTRLLSLLCITLISWISNVDVIVVMHHKSTMLPRSIRDSADA